MILKLWVIVQVNKINDPLSCRNIGEDKDLEDTSNYKRAWFSKSPPNMRTFNAKEHNPTFLQPIQQV